MSRKPEKIEVVEGHSIYTILSGLRRLCECHTYAKKKCTKNLGFQGQRFSLNFNLLLN